jgi:hypothetical protein
MAGEGDDSPVKAQGAADVPVKLEDGVAKWIRDVGAIVTILGVLVGFGFTAYQLRMKAKSDEESARLNQEAEVDKLALGREQIKAQNTQHMIDIQQQRYQLAAAEKKDEHEALSTLINSMFAHANSEGDIVGLFESVHRDDESHEVITNALLARLENPRSKEEIDLGFRVLTAIGPSAIDGMVQVNSAARRSFNGWITREFLSRYAAKAKEQFYPGGYQFLPTLRDDVITELAAATSLDSRYIAAFISSDLPDLASAELEALKLKDQRMPIEMVEAVINRSNEALDTVLHSVPNRHETINLSYAYLNYLVAYGKYPPWVQLLAKCNTCFVEDSPVGMDGSWLGGVSDTEDAVAINDDNGSDSEARRYTFVIDPGLLDARQRKTHPKP